MESVRVERLDHLGVIASVINDLGLIDMINARLVPDDQEVVAPGEAVAGMILNGLGFGNRPLSLTPQFFASKPLDLLFREGLEAKMFNRFKLRRTLDEAHAYGCDLLFHELALAICAHEGIDLRFDRLDAAASLSGEYVPERDERAITITHGYSRDHRPDLKQAMLELMVSQDDGVPFVSKSWDGNTSNDVIFQARAQALLATFGHFPQPTVSDRRLETVQRRQRHPPPRPRLYHPHSPHHRRSLTGDHASPHVELSARIDATTRYQRLELCHYGMAQRWLVVHSQAALARAETTVNKARQRGG